MEWALILADDQARQLGSEHVQIKWLTQELVKPCFNGSALGFFVRIAAQPDDYDVLESRLLADLPGHLIAVHEWQPDVEQHSRGLERAHCHDGRRAVTLQPHFVTVAAQQGSELVGHINVVLDQEDAQGGRVGAASAPACFARNRRNCLVTTGAGGY